MFEDILGNAALAQQQKKCCTRRPFPQWPRIDLVENENEFVVKANVPGIAKEDLKVQVEENSLVLKYDKEEKEEHTEDNVIKSERRHTSFKRVVEIPSAFDADKISATSADGVLTVSLPKTAESVPKTIDIQ